MTTTTLINNAGKTVTRTGTSGFTVTGVREGQHLNVLMEFDEASHDEAVAMVATVLTQLEELHGEGFVAAILAHYAEDTGKEMLEAGDHKIAMIRGYKRAKGKQ